MLSHHIPRGPGGLQIETAGDGIDVEHFAGKEEVRAHPALQGMQVDVAEAEGKKVRVVSMPSSNRFDKQDAAYRESVLPAAVSKRVAIEAGIADFWYKYVGFEGRVVGMNSFGESAPADQLFKLFGFTVDNVVAKAKEIL